MPGKRRQKRPAKKGKRTMRGMRRPNKSKLGLNPAVQNRNYACMTETYKALVGSGPNTSLIANTPYIGSVSIAQYPRARALSRCYKFYRLKAVVFEYQPDANTYQAGTGAAETIPYMYYIMNRDGADSNALNEAQIRNAGARPIKFTKKITIAYKPNLIQASQLVVKLGAQGSPSLSVYNGNNMPIYDKWISTNGIQQGSTSPSWAGDVSELPVQVQGDVTNPIIPPDQVNVLPYYGHSFIFAQQVTPAEATSVGYQSVTCIWEFKDPVLFPTGPGS